MPQSGAICCLLYGEYPDMHTRFMMGIRAIPDAPIFVGLNAIGPRSMAAISRLTDIPTRACNLDGHAEYGRYRVFCAANKNRLKYPVMRDMYSQVGEHWTLWVDDDVMLPLNRAWWDYTCSRMDKGVDYLGTEYLCAYAGQQATFVQSRPWYRGLPPVIKGGRPTFVFHLGAFHALSSRARIGLDWPDPLLRHRGGDTLLGEAIRQGGYSRERFPCTRFGIQVNGPRRRGHDETPLGVKP